MFLATTALTEFWDPGQETLFLGSWCLPYERRGEWAGRRSQIMPSPWNDRKRFYEATAAVEEHHRRLLSHLGGHLNGVLGTSFSPRYWQILIGPWLLHFLHPLYDRHVHLTEALRLRPDLRTILLDPASFQTPADVRTLVDGVCGDLYNLQLFSQLLCEMGFSFPVREAHLKSVPGTVSVPGTERSAGRESAAPLKRIAKKGMLLAENAARRLQGKMWQIALCDIACSSSMAWALAWKTGLKALPLRLEETPFLETSGPLFDRRRNGLSDLPVEDEFERLFVRCLPRNLPCLYLEDFHRAREEALRRTPRIPPVILSGNGWYFNEPFKFLAAEAAERGSRLAAVQHGGGYGVFRYSALERHESRVGDSWMVWGWAEPPAKGKNLPHHRISAALRLKAAPNRAKGESPILFVATAQPRYLYRFHSAPVGSQWEEYFDWQIRFMASLSPQARDRLLFRPYPQEHGHAVRTRLTERFPDLRWDGARPYYRRLKESRLVVVDHVATTFLESLAVNAPTVLFWDAERWEVRPEAEPHFESLRRAGILLGSPEEAAEAVSRIQGDPAAWWKGAEVQAARERFVRRFALGREDWLECWSRALEEEAALSRTP